MSLCKCSLYATIATLALPVLSAAELVIVTHSAAGAWSMQSGESLSVNGKEKIRRIGAAAGAPDTWDSKAIGKLQSVEITSFAFISRSSDGRLWGRPESASEWQPLLPDGLKTTNADTAAHLWTGSSLGLKHDKKDKTPSPVAVEELYAVLSGSDAASLAATFVADPGLHKVPGMDDAQAFRNSVELIPVAAKAFPSEPALERMRESVRAGMAERIDKWNKGDVPIDVLNDALLLAVASESAFAGDPKQAELRKQAREARKALDRRVAILRALDAGKQSDAFLLSYRDFEPYDKSFPDLASARRAHFKASAVLHVEMAQHARAAGDYANAIRHLRIAHWRDPKFTEASDMLEQVRIEVARLSAQQFAEARRGIDPRSPKQVQLKRRLLLAEQYIADSKALEAENAIKEAESVDKDEPRIKFLEAKLAVLRGDLAQALALLDLYAGLAITNQEFEQGETLRASVQYKIDTARKDSHTKLGTLSTDQRFASALETAANGLKLDNEDTDFLFQAGVNACVLRNCDHAGPLLRRYLDITDASGTNREQRMAAMRLLRHAGASAEPQVATSSTLKSWFSDAPLDPGSFYDPVSLAFQPKVARVKGSNHLTVAYEWEGAQLKSVHTRYEDKKTGTNVLKIAVAAGAASQGVGSTVGWRTPDRETNDFYFNYYEDKPQVLKVSRDNVITKSRTIPITIPGIGGFGGFGAVSGLMSGMMGGLGGLRGGVGMLGGLGGSGKLAGMFGGASGAPVAGLGAAGGFGGLAGFGGVGGAGALRALVTARSINPAGGLNEGQMNQMLRSSGPGQTASIHTDPQGGSTSGFLTLWNSPRLDTQLAFEATGKRVAVVFSGNSYFHPFVWDAIHLFEVDYDSQGRVQHAWELDNPGAPRLDFTWQGKQLMQINGYAATGGAVVYSRTLQYSGDKLVSETITSNSGKSSHIKYKYDKQDRMIEADCEDDHALDGRSRQIEFIVDAAKGGKR
jgi:hypothetical protein